MMNSTSASSESEFLAEWIALELRYSIIEQCETLLRSVRLNSFLIGPKQLSKLNGSPAALYHAEHFSLRNLEHWPCYIAPWPELEAASRSTEPVSRGLSG